MGVAALAAAIWIHELAYVDVSQTGDLGLAAQLPVPALFALFVLVVDFTLAVHFGHAARWLLPAILVTIVMLLFGLSAMLESEARFAATWRFFGFADYILRHHSLYSQLDIYFDYPGFSVALASLAGVSGLQSLENVANWTPVLFNLLYLPPIFMILSALSLDRRVVWLGLGFFLIGNWVSQDYIAPQGLAFFLYLILLGLVLHWFRVAHFHLASLPRSGHQAALLIAFLGVFAAIVVSHPLTPFFAISAVTALVVLRRVRPWWLPVVMPWWLPVLMSVMTAAWIGFMARDFLAGHMDLVTGGVGALGSNLDKNVTSRVTGSPGHLFVVQMRLVSAAAIWALALGGLLRSWRHHTADLRALALMISPSPLLALQAYGGEMLLRIYLFALPFVAFYAARLFYPDSASVSRWTVIAIVIAVTALLTGFLFTRYGNEREDYYSPQEVAAARQLYLMAPPGSLLLSGDGFRPARFARVEQYGSDYLDPEVIAGSSLPAVEGRMRKAGEGQSFLFISRSQKAYIEMSSGQPPGALDSLQRQLEASADFEVAYSNRDAEIFILKPTGQGHGR